MTHGTFKREHDRTRALKKTKIPQVFGFTADLRLLQAQTRSVRSLKTYSLTPTTMGLSK